MELPFPDSVNISALYTSMAFSPATCRNCAHYTWSGFVVFSWCHEVQFEFLEPGRKIFFYVAGPDHLRWLSWKVHACSSLLTSCNIMCENQNKDAVRFRTLLRPILYTCEWTVRYMREWWCRELFLFLDVTFLKNSSTREITYF